MEKKKQGKGKRARSFKVHTDFNGNPFIRFGGKYLRSELGITSGDRLELIRDNDLIILRKFSETELFQYEAARQERAGKTLLKKLFDIPLYPRLNGQTSHMMIAESRSVYSVDKELSKHPEKYSQI